MDASAYIKKYKEEMIQEIIKLVSIKSVQEEALPGKPFGEGPAKALQYTLELGEKFGFQTENFGNYVAHIDFGEQEQATGILVHVDVVPTGEGWICDPFSPEVIDNNLYGRGVVDDKGPLIVCLYAMRILKEMAVPLRKKVRMIVGANEETNWDCVEHYFHTLQMKPPVTSFAPDHIFPVTYGEKGVLQFRLISHADVSVQGGNAYNSVPDTAEFYLPLEVETELKEILQKKEKSKCDFELKRGATQICLLVKGAAAHGAHPELGENAVTAAMEVVAQLSYVCEETEFARKFCTVVGTDIYGKTLGISMEDKESGPLTMNVGMVGVKEQKAYFCLDVRVPVTKTNEEVIDLVQENAKKAGFAMDHISSTPPLLVPKDSFLVQTLMKVYQEVTGDYETLPMTSSGCTYARATENCVPFGALLAGQAGNMHEKNEYLELDKLDTWLNIYLFAIYELAK